MLQNVPNPFNPATRIRFELARESYVSLQVLDVRGKLMSTLLNDLHKPGAHEVFWNGTNWQGQRLSAGVYLYRLRTNTSTESRKLTLLR